MPQDSPLPEDNPYGVIARFYDLEYRDYQEDLPFYLNLAQRTGGPVLDVGTGTGRVAFALAKAGHSVVGIDSSPAMLQLARRKARGTLAQRVRFIQADMTSFSLNEQFPLVLVTVNTFCHLLTREEQSQALSRLREHLTPDGLLVIGFQNPYLWALDTQQHQVLLQWERPGPGKAKQTFNNSSAWSDLARQVRHIHLWYDVAGFGAILQRYSTTLSLRWCYRFELELLLEQHGLKAEQWYGSYDLEPYTEESPLLMVMARKG